MTPTVSQELTRMAEEISRSERIDLAYILDMISAASLMLQSDGGVPELVTFLTALGRKVDKASTELMPLQSLISDRISPAVGVEIGRIWGDPDLVVQRMS